MPRLFTGIEVPSDIAFELSLLQGGIPDARWVAPENMHITLRFAGDIPEHTAAELDSALSAIHGPSMQLTLHGCNHFGGRKPRALFIGIDHSEALEHLQSSHEIACQRAGLEPEGRRFIPHVTLARLSRGKPTPVTEFVSRNALYRSRTFDVNRFVLFSSRPSTGGGPYAVERSYDLDASM